uniref:Putative tRNA-methyl transferase n=1 Tax=Trypanosoma congolense (strain IL3000) TaxID=1068625 RepID=G0URE5_TRYCI|nr:putative tRNA-methyl transferase [Trypanosoma congolense IL3000]
MGSGVVQVAIALSGGVDSAVAALLLHRCVATWRDVEALWCSPRPLSLDEVVTAIAERRSWADLVTCFPQSWMAQHNPAAEIRYHPLFMKNWDDLADSFEGGGGAAHRRRWCGASWKDYDDATEVARKVGLLPDNGLLQLYDFSSRYVTACFDPMLNAYARGETLNVDVLCNSEVKFGALLRVLLDNGRAQYIATGHYSRTIALHNIEPCSDMIKDKMNNARVIARPFTAGNDLNDQTLFLSRLSRFQASRAIFPLGHVFGRKADVRAVARYFGLTNVSEKKTSTGLCFVGERYRRSRRAADGFCAFLTEYIAPSREEPSDVSAAGGAVTKFLDAGTDRAVPCTSFIIPGGYKWPEQPLLPAHCLTIGQRLQGLRAEGEPVTYYYVQCKEVLSPQGYMELTEDCCTRHLRAVWLVNSWDHRLLYRAVVKLRDVLLTMSREQLLPQLSSTQSQRRSVKDVRLRCCCCARHQEPLQAAELHFFASDVHETGDGGTRVHCATVEFSAPVRAPTAGQALVAYRRVALGVSEASSSTDPSAWFVAASGWIV